MEREKEKLQSTGEKLQVLNSVLRHNVRTQMNIVIGNAEVATESGALDAKTADCLETIEATARRTVELAHKARQINTIDTAGSSESTAVEVLLERVVEDIQAAFPAAAIDSDVQTSIAVAPSDTVELVLLELTENSLEHNDRPEAEREVHVTVRDGDGSTIDVVVEDNGPGVPDRELRPLFEEEETPLEHGSALGLWMVKWAVDRLDGALSFDTGPDRGTRIVVTIPLESLACTGSATTDAVPESFGERQDSSTLPLRE
jgi:signal transduction histidine kinase